METNNLSLSSMPDVCFSGWFRVIYFTVRHKPVLSLNSPALCVTKIEINKN